MKKVMIVFGSQSDEHVYDEVISGLKDVEGVSYEMRVLSAHRTPDELTKVISTTDADVIIAGAGVAAALPGVVAAQSLKPIIGVPVESNYRGLDSMLSIMQMPPGIPVMGVGVNKGRVAAAMALQMLEEYTKVHVFGDESHKAVKKALDTLDHFKIAYELNPSFSANSLNIKFVSLDEVAGVGNDLVIYVPLLDKDDDKAEAALNVLKNSTNGLWVGLNRGENAALACVKILNFHGQYTEALQHYRRGRAAKIIQADKEARKK